MSDLFHISYKSLLPKGTTKMSFCFIIFENNFLNYNMGKNIYLKIVNYSKEFAAFNREYKLKTRESV